MRVATQQLAHDAVGDVVEVELAVFRRDLGVEHGLVVAELVAQLRGITALDGVGELVDLLQRVLEQRGVILGQVPGAARLRVTQPAHEFAQITDVVTPHAGLPCHSE